MKCIAEVFKNYYSSSLYLRHMKYVEGYIVFVFLSVFVVPACVHTNVNILRQKFCVKFFPFAYIFESLHFRMLMCG